MSKPVFSDLFTFESGRRNRRSFLILVLVGFAAALAIVAWIVVPFLLAQSSVMEVVASGQPIPQPGDISILRIVLGLSLGLARIALLVGIIVALWSAAAQRFHDIGYSGWAILWLAAPLIQLYFVYLLFFRRGNAGENRFGPDPLLSAT